MKKSMSCEVAPTYVMTIIVRPLTGSPPCASLRSPARAARSAHLRTPPLGAGALCRNVVEVMIITSWATGIRYNLGTQEQPSHGVSVLGLPASSLRCGGRQGSSLRSDELREQKTVRFALDCLLAAAHGYIELLTQLRTTASNPFNFFWQRKFGIPKT